MGIVCLSMYDMTEFPVSRFTVEDRYFPETLSFLAYQRTLRSVQEFPPGEKPHQFIYDEPGPAAVEGEDIVHHGKA